VNRITGRELTYKGWAGRNDSACQTLILYFGFVHELLTYIFNLLQLTLGETELVTVHNTLIKSENTALS